MENITLKELAVDHDYYASDSNYYSNNSGHYTTFADFYDDFIDADIDMNLIFRWDIKKHDESERYYVEIFMILQRKGIYMPHMIDHIREEDVPKFIELVTKHWQKLISIWSPISTGVVNR